MTIQEKLPAQILTAAVLRNRQAQPATNSEPTEKFEFQGRDFALPSRATFASSPAEPFPRPNTFRGIADRIGHAVGGMVAGAAGAGVIGFVLTKCTAAMGMGPVAGGALLAGAAVGAVLLATCIVDGVHEKRMGLKSLAVGIMAAGAAVFLGAPAALAMAAAGAAFGGTMLIQN